MLILIVLIADFIPVCISVSTVDILGFKLTDDHLVLLGLGLQLGRGSGPGEGDLGLQLGVEHAVGVAEHGGHRHLARPVILVRHRAARPEQHLQGIGGG